MEGSLTIGVSSLALINLDFEYELGSGKNYRPPSIINALNQRWRSVLRLLPEARDADCLDPAIPMDDPRARAQVEHLTVWGVTPRIKAIATQLGLDDAFPSLEVVREVNDKRFSHQLEKELGIDLPHSRVVISMIELQEAVQNCPFDWVLKHPLGFSARERVVGKRHDLTDSPKGWAKRKLAEGWTLLFEPWVEERRDYSLHFDISRDGAARYLGHCELLADPGGVYRGNRVIPSTTIDPQALECGGQVAEALARLGYWGLVGIDAFQGVLGGESVQRPLVEINARCSFGRLALSLGEWIPDGWHYLWWHPSRADAVKVALDLRPLGSDSSQAPGYYALPELADPRGESGTVIAIAEDHDELDDLERRMIS